MGADGTSTGDRLIVRKAANALIADARLRPLVDFAMKVDTLGASTLMFESYRAKYGGLWVGGNFYLYENRIVFEPNFLNKVIQNGNLSVTIMLSDVTDVAWKYGGIITSIVDVTHSGVVSSFRCFGSKGVAQNIEKAASAAGAALAAFETSGNPP